MATAFFNISNSSCVLANCFLNLIISAFVVTSPFAISIGLYKLIHLYSVAFDTPYSLINAVIDFQELYKLTIICLNSSSYLVSLLIINTIPLL